MARDPPYPVILQRKMDVSHRLVNFILIFDMALSEMRDFSTCHDDFSLNPPDGVLKEHTFTWLGFVQYLHVTTGLLHHSKAPRVVLIHKQFAAGTATDLLQLPKNYKLGHVIFGDYERDEEDCGLTSYQAKMGVLCPRAYIEIPNFDVRPHPEYSRFGVSNSLALLKLLNPVKSAYMVPICLPTLVQREKKRKNKFVSMIDYISSVPRDFDSERMGKKTLEMFTHEECRIHTIKTGFERENLTHVLCSSGCGVRNGAPIISHSADGPFELMGIAVGGAPCSERSMRNKFNSDPPFYIDVYPYVGWIVNVISAHMMPHPYPEKFMMVDQGSSMGIHTGFFRSRKKQKSDWRGRTFVTGNDCFKSIETQKHDQFFYSEKFEVNAGSPTKLDVVLELSAGIECTITCARMLMPNRHCEPKIEGVGGYNITVAFTSEWFPDTFQFSLGLNGKNTTDEDLTTWLGEQKPGFW